MTSGSKEQPDESTCCALELAVFSVPLDALGESFSDSGFADSALGDFRVYLNIYFFCIGSENSQESNWV